MIKIFGRQLFFRFHHIIYNFLVDREPNESNLICKLISCDELGKIDMGYFSLRMLRKVLQKNPEKAECYAFINDDEKVVGFALVSLKGAKEIHYHVRNADAFITALGVFREYRGRGYSQMILNELVQICYRRGFTILSLSVDSDNYPAIGAYEKFGFTKIGDKRFIRALGVDFLLKKTV